MGYLWTMPLVFDCFSGCCLLDSTEQGWWIPLIFCMRASKAVEMVVLSQPWVRVLVELLTTWKMGMEVFLLRACDGRVSVLEWGIDTIAGGRGYKVSVTTIKFYTAAWKCAAFLFLCKLVCRYHLLLLCLHIPKCKHTYRRHPSTMTPKDSRRWCVRLWKGLHLFSPKIY